MPGTTGSTAARASAEVAQTAVPSDAAAQAESTARRDHAAEREPRAGTAILNTTTDRSGTAAPVATTSPAPQAFAASPTASGAATAPPSFASAEIAARLAEGDAEKLAQGLAPAGDAEIALTPLRADRDAEFRAVLRQAPAAPVPAANLAREVMQAAISAKGSGSIELRIDPVELGKLDIEFSVVDDRMNIIVRADREEALDLMRRNSDDLQKMLREAGVDLGSLSFSQGGSRDPQQEHRFGVSGAGGDSAVSGGPASTLPPVQSSERLDIRV